MLHLLLPPLAWRSGVVVVAPVTSDSLIRMNEEEGWRERMASIIVIVVGRYIISTACH